MKEAVFALHTLGSVAERFGAAFASAHADKPCYAFLLPDSRTRQAALGWLWGHYLAHLAIECGTLQVDQRGEAAAFVILPGKQFSMRQYLDAGLASFPAKLGWVGSWRMLTALQQLMNLRQSLAPEPHVFVLAINVLSQRQGRGLGYDMLTDAIRRSEAESVPCYTQVFQEKEVEYYLRRGFRVAGKKVLPMGLTVWGMVRVPSEVATVLSSKE